MFSAPCPGHGILCTEMLIAARGKVGSMHGPTPETETLSSATAQPQAPSGPWGRPESGHGDWPVARSLESSERLRNPSFYVFVLLIYYKTLKTYINTERLNN